MNRSMLTKTRFSHKAAIGLYILLSLLMTLMSQQAKSLPKLPKQAFATPQALKQAPLKDRDDAKALIHSNAFYAELKALAAQLTPAQVAQQSVFYRTALMSIRGEHTALQKLIVEQQHPLNYHHYLIYVQALAEQATNAPNRSLKQIIDDKLKRDLATTSDERLYQMNAGLGWSLEMAEDYTLNVYRSVQGEKTLTASSAMSLIVNTELYRVLAEVIPVSQKRLQAENQQRYVIEPEVLITTDKGIELAATIVRKRDSVIKRPVALQFTIYADEKSHIQLATHAAAHGYVGIVANSRGKRSSRSAIVPWALEGQDATSVIDWASKQSWSDGQVVMYGASYNGFTQWAAAKYKHPALKAIAPYTAANPITGLPFENNIARSGNYQWSHHVTNNKTMDNSVYADWQHTRDVVAKLYQSGRPFADIDYFDGKPNPWLQKLLAHPSYDDFYQKMLPYGDDYADINIPVLTITGYFDGAQVSAVDFLTRHYKHNPNANHTLLIGPYTHRTSGGVPDAQVDNYTLDRAALKKDTEEVTFHWFDHLLFDQPVPELLKGKVNYQLMGDNSWWHVDSYRALNAKGKDYYFNTQNHNGIYQLTDVKPIQLKSVSQVVDMADRSEERNVEPVHILQNALPQDGGIVLMTEPFTEPHQLAGAISGEFMLAVNKKDVDIGFNFYELQPDGQYFHLNRYVGRASYADDMAQRKLLKPNDITKVTIVNGRMSAKLLKPGSRLVIVLNVNKNREFEVNMGNGTPVSFESAAAAGEPLKIQWFNQSRIHIPVTAITSG